MNLKHFRSSLKYRELHRAACKCKGRGFRYHILGMYH